MTCLESGDRNGQNDSDSPPGPGRTLCVRRDNVLHARAVLLREANELRAFLTVMARGLEIPPLADDLVSRDAAAAFTHRLRDADDSYFMRCWQYTDNLLAAAAELATVARKYGYTEAEIAASSPLFAGRSADDGAEAFLAATVVE
ncbi:hypothetical protein [Streptoalloteichus hindustanus]|uniref:PE family protein n=1 Tax=Streptoalloteichus hindustanus TaxID=2017 RepID=A0A1M5QAQ5_STRHI|nr:hypothetical protein [Streptoalloteichus hindustanus]SHH11254.1 hypothetical protein SAMN05444320_1235 [Streptoalloteichus hindustanus]